MSLDNIAVSGLLAFQRALSTTSHNITNVATEGYSRQRVDLSSRNPQLIGAGYLGKGVQVDAIQRAHDQFVVNEVNLRTSSYNQMQSYYSVASRLDTILGDSDIGLSPALQGFFDSVQDVSTNPTSIPARQVMLSKAESLSDMFHTLNGQLDAMASEINGQLEASVEQINGLANAIADLNKNIIRAQGAAGGAPPNDLLDQRDVLIEKLSEMVSVTTTATPDGAVNIYIGTGQSLVLGVSANSLGIERNSFDVTQNEVALVVGNSSLQITGQLKGGKVGGLLGARTEVIQPAQLALGRIAVAVSETFNAQHQLGEDLNGNAGGAFFSAVNVSAPTVLPNSKNNPASGTISVSVDDSNALYASDYRLNYDGTNFSLIRQSDGVTVDSGFTTADFPRTIGSEGITLSLSGSFAAGDSFLVRPVRYAAGQTGLAISNPAQIAAAAAGTASGNNENALALAALQTQKVLSNGTASYHEAFGELVAQVGIKTNQAFVNGEAQRSLLNQAKDTRSSISGVNLDEEAANLIKFQQAYQAAARVITVSDTLFQSLLNAVGR